MKKLLVGIVLIICMLIFGLFAYGFILGILYGDDMPDDEILDKYWREPIVDKIISKLSE